jgi:hypothetical protein
MAIAELPQDDDLFKDNKGPVLYDLYYTWGILGREHNPLQSD